MYTNFWGVQDGLKMMIFWCPWHMTIARMKGEKGRIELQRWHDLTDLPIMQVYIQSTHCRWMWISVGKRFIYTVTQLSLYIYIIYTYIHTWYSTWYMYIEPIWLWRFPCTMAFRATTCDSGDDHPGQVWCGSSPTIQPWGWGVLGWNSWVVTVVVTPIFGWDITPMTVVGYPEIYPLTAEVSWKLSYNWNCTTSRARNCVFQMMCPEPIWWSGPLSLPSSVKTGIFREPKLPLAFASRLKLNQIVWDLTGSNSKRQPHMNSIVVYGIV